MKKIFYFLSRLFNMNFSNFFKTIKFVCKKTKKNYIFIFFDIIICSIIYGAGYTDYYSFGMYNLNSKQRRTILTRGINNKYVAQLNPKKYWHLFDNKNEFNVLFDKYLKRKWLYLENKSYDEFYDWVSDLDYIIAKPNDSSGGQGIKKIKISEYDDLEVLYNELLSNKLYLLEEVIKQHSVLEKLYPNSVNTLRIITVLTDNGAEFLISFLRIGNNGFVDNTCSGGMLTIIDINTGITLYDACDSNLNIYDVHPKTKVKIKGIKIPFFKEAKDLCKNLAEKTNEMRYIAWDVAITNDGPVIVEGNPYPGYYYQFPVHCPNKKGILPRFKEILK